MNDTRGKRRRAALAILVLLLTHGSLLAWQSFGDSPTWDEIAHVAAALEHWKHGTFYLFTPNPPLIRLLVTAPIVVLHPEIDTNEYQCSRGPGTRPEFGVGTAIAQQLGRSYFSLMSLCRLMYIPISQLGAYICYLWARELWGEGGGLLTMTLWTFSPSILAYAHIITPDLGSAALGVAAAYVLRRWLHRPSWGRACAAGILLGLAELTKTTWIGLLPLWPMLWIAYRLLSPERLARREWLRQGSQMLVVLLLAAWTLNLGYGFEGSFKLLRHYRFVSRALGGDDHPYRIGGVALGNRFEGSVLGYLPMPVPENYLCGIDYIKMEFEQKRWSYLRGRWQLGGWWYYYPYALLVKEPLGEWLLIVLACAAGFRRRYSQTLREMLLVAAPLLLVATLLITQTGFSHHIRYALPLFPFAFIWLGKLGKAFSNRDRPIAMLASSALAWSTLSSLASVPHSMSYFNESVGGPRGGHRHLALSNTDWGQDLLYLKQWYDRHPEARPLHLGYDMGLIDPAVLGIERLPLPGQATSDSWNLPGYSYIGPTPGWYAISVNQLHSREHSFDYFQDLCPIDWVGDSMPIFHLSAADAAKIRSRFSPHNSSDAR